ncbi:MAG TPA: threonine/serine dehydratase [Gemmatimonadaceae bacterium]|nr:threonine/serine dehydratase [Gemmatimonadaceae bacterium]
MPGMFSEVRAHDVLSAARRLAGVARHTALRRSTALGAIAGCDVYLKLESEQITGSFKLRGAYNLIASLPDDVRERGVVASSAGNHGLGVAWASHHFGIPATIFVPETAPRVKREGIAALGATVDAESPHYDAAMERAIVFAEERGATFVHPCTGRDLLAGQGTVAAEVLEELPELRTLVVPVGGGGLLGGCGALLRNVAPGVRIVGAQSVNTAAMARSLEAKAIVHIPSVPTLADGLAGDIDDIALDIGLQALDEIHTVAEEAIGRAIAWLAREEELVVEGAGAVGVAAILEHEVARPEGPLAIVVSGGNIDRERHESLLERW